MGGGFFIIPFELRIPAMRYSFRILFTISLFSIFSANFIIWARPLGSNASTSDFNHGLNPFMKVSSRTIV